MVGFALTDDDRMGVWTHLEVDFCMISEHLKRCLMRLANELGRVWDATGVTWTV